MKKERLWTAVMTVGIIILVTTLTYFNVLRNWDSTMLDLLTQKASSVKDNIFIIGIDDKTLKEYGKISDWSRELSGKLVEILSENPENAPAVIGFDVIYSENREKESDQYFADACRKAGNVVVAASYEFKKKPERDQNGTIVYNPFYVDYAVRPYEELEECVTTGFANTTVDYDGYVRQAMANIEYQQETVLSFPAQVYKVYQESRGEPVVLPKTYGQGNRFYFSYSGKPGAYTVISMADVLDGAVDPRIFKDAIVLIGAYEVGMQDSFQTAIWHGETMYGVEIHANIIQAFLEEKTQVPFSRLLYSLFSGILCGCFFLFAKKGNMLKLTLALVGMFLGNMFLVKLMHQNGYILPVMFLPLALLVLYAGHLVYGYLTERMRRKQVVSVFKQYVAPQVVDKISKDKDFNLVLGGENRPVAVLFVDIRGFTSISESLPPEQVVEILNEYLSLTTKAIFENKGTLDKFVGDAAMAVFNAPFDLEDYVFKAVCAAWDISQGAAGLAKQCEERFGTSIAFGIGIHCGNAVVGNIGCDFRMDYTAIGDTVNTAARLESNAKAGQILISEKVYEVVADRIQATPIGEIALKGKSQGVFVYQVDQVKKEQAR